MWLVGSTRMSSKIAVLLIFILLSGLVYAEPKYLVCSCTSDGHASVYFVDGSTGNSYGRGLYPASNAPSSGKAPKLEHAGTVGEGSDTSSSGGSSASSGSTSGSSGGSSSSSATTSAPSSSSGSAGLDVLNGPGVVADDDGVVAKKCVCYEVTKDEYDKAVDYVNDYNTGYALLSNNCVDFSTSVLNSIGKDTPCSTAWYGVSTPWSYWECMNEWRDAPDKSFGGDDGFIAYGNETDKFDKYRNSGTATVGNGTVNATANGTGVQEESHYRVQDEKFGYTEELIKNPDVLYSVLARSGTEPVERIISASAAGGRQCGTNCLKAAAGEEIAFSADFSPNKNSLVWWDFGDGERSFAQSPSHSFAKPGWYFVKMRYLDEGRNAKFGWHKLRINGAAPKQIPGEKPGLMEEEEKEKRRVSTPSGNEIVFREKSGQKLDVSQASERLKSIPELQSFLGGERTRVHVKRKDGSTAIGDLNTGGGRIELSFLGTVDADNEKLFEQNPQMFIGCVPASYTGALYADEETLEKIASSSAPIEELKAAWGSKIYYRGHNFGSSMKAFMVDVGVKLGVLSWLAPGK